VLAALLEKHAFLSFVTPFQFFHVILLVVRDDVIAYLCQAATYVAARDASRCAEQRSLALCEKIGQFHLINWLKKYLAF
jgi:hypothetical protein